MLGWAISPYRGHKVVLHPGNLDGFSTVVVLLPQDNISLSILVNLDGTYFPFAVAFYCIDLLLGFTPQDWNSFYLLKEQTEAKEAQEAWQQMIAQRKNNTHPSHDNIADYTGTFYDSAYGAMAISLSTDGTGLVVNYFDALVNYPLTHWQYDIFAVVSGESAMFFDFQTDDVTGIVTSVLIPMESSVAPTNFIRG